MATNTYKDSRPSGGRRNVFSFIESFINVEKLFENGLPLHFLMPILFVTALSIIYIGNLHYAEKNIRKTTSLRVEVEDLRADYTTLKADYMFASKQSEVAKKAHAIGLKESVKPPYKIIIHEDE